MTSQVTRETIDLNGLLARAKNASAGAVLLFSGDVRDHSEGRAVDFLEYETHESMAQKQVAEIVMEAKSRWDLHYVEVIHRFGKMRISDCSIGIVVASSHRKDAYEASRFIIDTVKKSVPIWKKEHFTNGQAIWVEGCEASSVSELNKNSSAT
jgi:molybdopterin synthase catalytic subunit